MTLAARPRAGLGATSHSYQLYGLRVLSPWRFPYAEIRTSGSQDITLVRAPAAFFARARHDAQPSLVVGEAAVWATMPDGGAYVCWSGLLEAVIAADGRQIACQSLPGAPPELLHNHLLGPALSFALLQLGIEPLHSTVVVVGGQAIAFMGDSGYGKSSLGAAFLAAGHRLLTDDLLVLERSRDGFLAQPGAPRIKLFPKIALHLFGRRPEGTRMSPVSPKLIVPLLASQRPLGPVPLKAIYLLSPPGRQANRLQVRGLSARQACLEIVRNTFNMAVTDGPRQARLLSLAGALVRHVPIRRLSYPRRLAMLAAARDAILADLSG